MGRNRKDGDPLGLAGTRLAFRHGSFYYRHRDGRWEKVGTDIRAAKERSALYQDPQGIYGTVAYWLDMFIVDCEARVKAKDMSARTVADYRENIEPLKVFFGRMLPEHIKPSDVQTYLEVGKRQGRAVRANRERACLSSCLSWLIRNPDKTTMVVNPCMRASGVKRNAEKKRDRYVTHAEYRAVYAAAPKQVKLMMELVYRTLQRPEVDVLGWTMANIVRKGEVRILRNKQTKTGKVVDIGLMPELNALINAAMGEVPVLHQRLVHTRDGEPYSYDGLSAMLKRAQDKVRKTVPALVDMPSFGFRDLKGKGATDMWLSGVPIEEIQLLCGHDDSHTTEIYVKQRWRETAAPNKVDLAG